MVLNIEKDIIRPVELNVIKSVKDKVMSSQKWRKHTIVYPTNGRQSVTLQWANDVAPAKDWNGMRQLEGWGTSKYNISGDKVENSCEFNRDDINDPDQRPFLVTRTSRFVDTFFDLRNSKWFGALLDTATIGPDGVPLFSTTHPIKGSSPAAVNSNLISGTGTSEANIVADFQTAMTTILNWKIRGGEYLYSDLDNLKFTILSRVTDFTKFKNIFLNDRSVGTASATEGQWKGFADIWPAAQLETLSGDWIILIEGYGLSPILQMVIHNLIFEWNRTGDSFFHKNVMAYGGSEYYSMVPAYWQAAIYINN